MIQRKAYLKELKEALKRAPIVALLGPRQSGKTTLARQLLSADSENYFDLENPMEARLLEEPLIALQGLKGLVVIDEVQREPSIFPVLRVLVDRPDCQAKFLILGSASPELKRQSAETLAGRVELVEMQGFDLEEVGEERMEELWLRGGFPRSFLARTEKDSLIWRDQFVRTFLERDLGMMGFGLSPKIMGRFWTMVSHYHGQIWNASEVAGSLGVAVNTARSYLDILEQTYMIRRLQPWHENLGKRLVKTPKIYFRDSGLFHCLQGIGRRKDLLQHPKLGASWEGFALECVWQVYHPREAYFYSVHSGPELDLFFFQEGQRWGVEFKRQDAPEITASMCRVIEDLGLDRLLVVYPGLKRYRLDEKIEVVPLTRLKNGNR